MKNQILLLLVTLIFPLTLQAQLEGFDSLLATFKAPINVYTTDSKHITKLGDQNNDGFDDFLIWNCRDTTLDIFFGSVPLDTIPKLKISVLNGLSLLSMDINNDGYLDIVNKTFERNKPANINIYYGGPLLDEIPDITFSSPQKHKDVNFWSLYKTEDFNNDGRNELVIFELDNRSSSSYPDSNWLTSYRFRCLIYNLGSEFDTLDYEVIETPADSLRLATDFRSGDINNDGYTDLITESYYYCPDLHGNDCNEDNNFHVSRIFYGNNQRYFIADKYYTTKDSMAYYSSIIPFLDYQIVNDMNGDGKEDILMRDYKNLYPYYYGWGISYGGDSLNFDINVGVNTMNLSLSSNSIENGDYNGDGYGDLLMKTGFEPTSAVLYLGEPNPEPGYIAYKSYSDGYGIGRMVENVGDVNGDGADDFCLGDAENIGQSEYELIDLFIIAGDTSVVVSVEEETPTILPEEYILLEAYPNPFNPSTTITYSLPSEAEVTIKIINTLGQEVATLINSHKKTGKYQVEFNTNKYGLSSGIYFVNMNINNQTTITKKIVLLK